MSYYICTSCPFSLTVKISSILFYEKNKLNISVVVGKNRFVGDEEEEGYY